MRCSREYLLRRHERAAAAQSRGPEITTPRLGPGRRVGRWRTGRQGRNPDWAFSRPCLKHQFAWVRRRGPMGPCRHAALELEPTAGGGLCRRSSRGIACPGLSAQAWAAQVEMGGGIYKKGGRACRPEAMASWWCPLAAVAAAVAMPRLSFPFPIVPSFTERSSSTWPDWALSWPVFWS